MDGWKLDKKRRSGRTTVKQSGLSMRGNGGSTLMDLKGLGDQAFSVNISNDTDLLRKPTSYLTIFDVPKVFSILSQSLPHLRSYPML